MLALSDTTNVLRTGGGAEATVNSPGQDWFAVGAPLTIGVHQYNVYTAGAATLLIDTDIDQNIS